ncbi:mitotic fidelity of chromosome transmission-related protein, partial [Oleoguttula sp. CCFEE 5521]
MRNNFRPPEVSVKVSTNILVATHFRVQHFAPLSIAVVAYRYRRRRSLRKAHNTLATLTFDKLELGKENVPPARGASIAKTVEMEPRKTPSQQHTPGRKGRTGNQYFDVGKVGRKTGITLKDTGLRDEHGMEPMAGIFSSPVKSPQRSPQTKGYVVISSEGMQESSGRDVDTTLHMRKTPRLPPPRASTPKHTNIGSPKRMSSSKPQSRSTDFPPASEISPAGTSHAPANRKIDFNNRHGVRMSIEDVSPFKPKRTLRRSVGSARQDPFMSSAQAGEISSELGGLPKLPSFTDAGADEEQDLLNQQLVDDQPVMFNDDYEPEPELQSANKSIQEALASAESFLAWSATRSSGSRAKNARSAGPHSTPLAAQPQNSRKRTRASLGDETNAIDDSVSQIDNSISQLSTTSNKRPRGRPRKSSVTVLRESPDPRDATIDPALLDHSDTFIPPPESDHHASDDVEETDPTHISIEDNEDEDDEDAAPVVHPSPAANPRKTKAPKPRGPRERDPNTQIRRVPTFSPARNSKSASAPPRSPSKRAGSVSNVALRASTPFEDAQQRVSRSGRPILAPLKHWAGEAYVWKNGEVEGVIRADEVKTPKKAKAKAKKRKSRKAARGGGLSDVEEGDEEESGEESLMPDDWEESLGVVAGRGAAR